MPSICTIAGRHAADRQRERDRAFVVAGPKLAALEALARQLRKRPLTVVTDFAPRADATLPTIAAKLRLDHCGVDYVYIDAALCDLGWTRSVTTMSRLNARYDIRVLDHQESGARVLLIITLPHGEIEHVEAA